MDKVRIGIVGLGNMGRFHANYILEGKVNRCELTSVCSIVPAELEPFPDLKQFSSSEELIRSGEIDAVLIATPHFQHTSMGIDALENGIHIMVEKPISVHKADCERLIQAHEKHPDRVFGAMFQLRAEPRWQKLKKLIDEGELGESIEPKPITAAVPGEPLGKGKEEVYS